MHFIRSHTKTRLARRIRLALCDPRASVCVSSWRKELVSSMTEPDRAPIPPFTLETATKKVKAAEDAWNSCDPKKVAIAYSQGKLRIMT